MDQAKTRGERGLTLVELLMALTVLTIGLAGLLPVFLGSLKTNARNKQDTGAVMVAQMVMEQIAASYATSPPAPTFLLQDCNGTNWPVSTAGDVPPTTPPGTSFGAWVAPNGPATALPAGMINWADPYLNVAPTYKMLYVNCALVPPGAPPSPGRAVTYEVRWNITQASDVSRLVTVGARPTSAAGAAPPVNLRMIIGNN